MVRGTRSPVEGERMALGRISGPLLKSNLVRDGVDLAFETDLLYIDVNNARIGVNNSSPTTDLDVNCTTSTTFVIVPNQINVGILHQFLLFNLVLLIHQLNKIVWLLLT